MLTVEDIDRNVQAVKAQMARFSTLKRRAQPRHHDQTTPTGCALK
jgi:hypothetical protein